MIVKFVVTKKEDDRVVIEKSEYNPRKKRFDDWYSSLGCKEYELNYLMNDLDYMYYKRWKASKSRRNYFYGIENQFPNPEYQNSLGNSGSEK